MNIEDITYNEDLITLHCGKNIIKLFAIGECCSYSYFHETSLNQLHKLVGSKFISLRYHDTLTDDETKIYKSAQNEASECAKIVKYILDTSTVKVTILLINESNGYYSGWIDMTINDKPATRDIL